MESGWSRVEENGRWFGRNAPRERGKPYDVLVVSLNAASYNATT